MSGGALASSGPWYRLDNAGILYPSIESHSRSAVFRFAITLTVPIDPNVLQVAVTRTLNRFPSFRVRLVRGVFWHYLEHNPADPIVEEDVLNPCMRINQRRNAGYLFRTRYHRNRIAMEFFHGLADGAGAMTVLKTVAGEYLRLTGHPVGFGHGVEDPDGPHDPEEAEDAYRRYYHPTAGRSRREEDAYHPGGTKVPPGRYHITSGTMPLKAVLKKAKSYGVSLTEYLAAVYMRALCRVQSSEVVGKLSPVRVSIPVNLRHFFPTKSLRNFASYVKVEVDPEVGEVDFEGLLKRVHHGMRLHLNPEEMVANFSPNVRVSLVPLIRMFPLPIKNLAISFVFNTSAENLFSGAISNLGRVHLPEDMEPFVERFDFNLGPGSINNQNCAVLSYRDQLVATFGRTIEESNIEREFFTFLVEEGVAVEVRSNRR